VIETSNDAPNNKYPAPARRYSDFRIKMTALTHDDVIEVISIHENNNQAFYDLTPSDVTHKFRVLGGDGDDVTDHDKTRVIPTIREVQSLKQKKIARIVMAVAIIMLLTSVLLVAITLTMSDHIDDMGEYYPLNYLKLTCTSFTPALQNLCRGLPKWRSLLFEICGYRKNKEAKNRRFISCHL
jgi:hypothetical protein